MQELAPIILFVYNRLWHVKKTVESLKANDLASESRLFIYSDSAKNDGDTKKVFQVRNYIRKINGFRSININEREKNFGLAANVISGVSEILKQYNKIIVLEDDIVCSSSFLSYMNNLLNFYSSNKKIYSVTGYTFPIKIPGNYKFDVYLAPRASSWGWGTWADRWNEVDWEITDFNDFINDISKVKQFNKGGDDLSKMLKREMNGQIDSWAIKWSYAHYKHNAYCIYPIKSRIINIGADESGVHTRKTKRFDVPLFNDKKKLNLPYNTEPNLEIMRNFKSFFNQNRIFKSFHYLRDLLHI